LSSFPNLVVQICFSEFVQSIRELRQSYLKLIELRWPKLF
jgi:hypothetical protein